MKTDRELLELAARAAGVRHIEYTNDYDGSRGLMMCNEHGRHTDTWSPLTDDGDALRLAVKLDIHIKRYAGATTAQELCSTISFTEHDHWAENNHDDLASTRRAIVRAAAAIGEAMQ